MTLKITDNQNFTISSGYKGPTALGRSYLF